MAPLSPVQTAVTKVATILQLIALAIVRLWVSIISFTNKYIMWVLLIIVLSSEPPYRHKGAVHNFYTSEAECKQQLGTVMKALYELKNTQISGDCTFKDYITPKKTF